MAIVDARIHRSLRLTEQTEKQTRKLSATQEFLVISDTKNPSFADVLSNTATFANLSGDKLPQLRDEVVVDGVTLVVSSRDLSWHEGSDRVVLMSVRYAGIDEIDGVDPPDDTNEETWRRISVRTQQVTVPATGWENQFGPQGAETGDEQFAKTALNSAFDPVDGLQEDVAIVALTYTNPRVVSPNFKKLNEYTNCCNEVNASLFLGAQGGYTVRVAGWSGEFSEESQTWSISVEFLYNPKGWQIEYVDAGFTEIVGGVRKVITDGQGNPVSQPVPLDGNGAAIAADAINVANVRKKILYPYPAKDLYQIWTDCGIA